MTLLAPKAPIPGSSSLSDKTEAFLRLLYPESCAVCRQMLPLEQSQLCGGCSQKLETLRYSPLDAVCDLPREHVTSAHTLFKYDTPLKEILHQIKFYKTRRLLRLFETCLTEHVSALSQLRTYHAIIPIPIHFSRRLEREFNQAELLAKMISKWTGIPIASNMLHKVHATPSQNELSREERLANLWGSFQVRKKGLSASQSFLLVDDILTTGATAEEAARVLRQHGAKHVDVIALARTEIGTS